MQLPKPSESIDFDPCPAGTHAAICYRFVDRGTQMGEYKGQKKLRHEIMLTWEIPEELMNDGRPFSITKTYTWSMSDKASLRHDLESWRGRGFTDADFEGPNAFNTKKLLGAPCMLTITHEERDGRIYAKLAGIGKLMKGLTLKPAHNPMTYLALTREGWSKDVFEKLSDKVKAAIQASPEYRELMAPTSSDMDGYDDTAGHELEDEIPF